MATFHVSIDVDNDAFGDSAELGRILHKLADRVLVQTIDGEVIGANIDADGIPLHDINGARVGRAWFTGGER